VPTTRIFQVFHILPIIIEYLWLLDTLKSLLFWCEIKIVVARGIGLQNSDKDHDLDSDDSLNGMQDRDWIIAECFEFAKWRLLLKWGWKGFYIVMMKSGACSIRTAFSIKAQMNIPAWKLQLQ
jgi:hypothetical protein